MRANCEAQVAALDERDDIESQTPKVVRKADRDGVVVGRVADAEPDATCFCGATELGQLDAKRAAPNLRTAVPKRRRAAGHIDRKADPTERELERYRPADGSRQGARQPQKAAPGIEAEIEARALGLRDVE
jgi:hypothetical protein